MSNKKQNKLTAVNNCSALSYQGKVTVSLFNGDTCLSKKTLHNTGYQELFNFICNCLAGNYSNVDRFRPLKIRLFNNTNSNLSDAINGLNSKSGLEDWKPASAFISVDTAPIAVPIESTNKNKQAISGYKTIFHFFVPAAYLIANDKDGIKVNQLILYNSLTDEANYTSGAMAYYLFTKMDGSELVWDDGIKISVKDADLEDLNLVINWELIVQNTTDIKNIEASTESATSDKKELRVKMPKLKMA